jgi:type II pantothenate kinase
VIEGMGRSVHTNWHAQFKCDAIKLSMIKNQHLAETLFKGNAFECVCRFDEGMGY